MAMNNLGEKLKRPDVGLTVTFLADVDVSAGIVFLAVELRRNNELKNNERLQVSDRDAWQFASTGWELPGCGGL